MVGDVIKLEPGSTIPADCIVIEANQLAVNETGMTGEPDLAEK